MNKNNLRVYKDINIKRIIITAIKYINIDDR